MRNIMQTALAVLTVLTFGTRCATAGELPLKVSVRIVNAVICDDPLAFKAFLDEIRLGKTARQAADDLNDAFGKNMCGRLHPFHGTPVEKESPTDVLWEGVGYRTQVYTVHVPHNNEFLHIFIAEPNGQHGG